MQSPRSRINTIPLIAGSPVIDLVNTVSWRGDPVRRHDHLRNGEDALIWCTRTHVLSEPEAATLQRVLATQATAAPALVIGLQDLRTTVAQAIVDAPTEQVHDLEGVFHEALTHSHLVPHGDSYTWNVCELDEHTPRRRLALALHELVTSAHGRVGVCADPACRWAFLDASRAQNRKWCSSTDCGNRHRVRQHTHHRTAQTPHHTSDA